MKFDDLINKKEEEKQVIDLLESENSYLKLISVKKNDGFNSKISHTNVFIYVMEGELEINFPKENTCSCCICGCGMPEQDKNNDKK